MVRFPCFFSRRTIRAAALASALALSVPATWAIPIEIHQHLVVGAQASDELAPTVALTLDACGGGFNAGLVDFLVEHRIPATIFATRKWLEGNPAGVQELLAHRDLFDIEDHGADHVPAVIGAGRRVYGLRGEPDLDHLKAEVLGGARAIEDVTGRAPRWYRGATAIYDPQAVAAIEALGFQVAGFSLNADAGATLREAQIVQRVRAARSGDVIIAHVNKPHSDTAAGLAVALADLLQRGYRFVRLDGAALTEALPSALSSDRNGAAFR
jgi:peptidoglycan/xylan/chitin deacetylase (PgdA/CDA1 family)